jgi:LysM repeat protein
VTQTITLTSKSPRRTVTALRGQTAPVPSGGFGGWQLITRPHRKSLTEWQGVEPMQLTFSLLLDGGAGRSSIENDCLVLEQMSQPNGAADPSVVRVAGAVPHSDLDWVIETLAWDGSPIYSSRGYRTRHEVTVTLREFVAPDLLPSAAATARAKTGSSGSTYVVKKGDTLVSIAAHQLGDYTRWQSIANLNGLRDPNKLTVGQKLRLP